MRRVEGDQLVHRDLVITKDTDIRAQLAKVLDEVVGEGVVVIDKYKHGKFLLSPKSKVECQKRLSTFDL